MHWGDWLPLHKVGGCLHECTGPARCLCWHSAGILFRAGIGGGGVNVDAAVVDGGGIVADLIEWLIYA